MSDNLDPWVQTLFERARSEMEGDEFVHQLMARIDAERRRMIFGWSLVVAALGGVAWFLAPPLIDAVGLLSQVLPRSLVEIEDPSSIVGQLLAPATSVSAVIAMTLLGVAWFLKKVF